MASPSNEYFVTMSKIRPEQRLPTVLRDALQEPFLDEKTAEAVAKLLKVIYPDFTVRVTQQYALY